MDTDTRSAPEPFRNGAGRTAMVDGQPVYQGTRIMAFGRAYTIQSAQPNGTGFRLFAYDAAGKLFEFKTAEVRLAQADAAVPPLAAAYPLVEITSKLLRQYLEARLAGQEPARTTKAVLAAAGWVQAIHARRWNEAAAYLIGVRSTIGREPDEFYREFSRTHSVVSQHYRLVGVPTWLPALAASQPAAPAAAPVLAPRPVSERKPRPYKPGHNNGDPVASYMARAVTAEQAFQLYGAAGTTDVAALTERYKHLQLGLLKMSLANRLRRAVAAGTATIPN